MIDRSYKIWLGGALASQLGNAVLFFALGWAASAAGGSAAALVLTAVTVPRAVLMLVGGAVGDRFGARPVLIAGDAVMLVVTAGLALAALTVGTPLPLLVAAALVVGVVDAFYLPSAGSMPRRLVEDVHLPRALALKQSGDQTVAMLGPPIGGALVAGAGFAAAAVADAVTFAVVLLVLIAIRPRFDGPAPTAGGLRFALRIPGLRRALFVVAAAAGLILPTTSLLVPLLARANGWTAAAAGLVVGAQGVGIVAATLTVARLNRPPDTAGVDGTPAGAEAGHAPPATPGADRRAAGAEAGHAPPATPGADRTPTGAEAGHAPPATPGADRNPTTARADRTLSAPALTEVDRLTPVTAEADHDPATPATDPVDDGPATEATARVDRKPGVAEADHDPAGVERALATTPVDRDPAGAEADHAQATPVTADADATTPQAGRNPVGGRRPRRAAAGGLAVVAAGQVGLALAGDAVGLAVAAGAVVGLGTGVFIAHLAPLLLALAPRTHLARVQALVGVVQSAALVGTTNLLGAIPVTRALFLCATGLLVTALGGLTRWP